MKDRQPFELKTVINIYNLIQIFINFYMVVVVSLYYFSNQSEPLTTFFTFEGREICTKIEKLHIVLHS